VRGQISHTGESEVNVTSQWRTCREHIVENLGEGDNGMSLSESSKGVWLSAAC
jgi:hypothetical protein